MSTAHVLGLAESHNSLLAIRMGVELVLVMVLIVAVAIVLLGITKKMLL